MKGRAFTLVELLVVVVIITLIVGIAYPALRNARVRAQVVTAQANLRNIQGALEWFASDHRGVYPPTRPVLPGDPLGLLCDHQLSLLTTPVQYLSSDSMRDPFGVVEAQVADPRLSGSNDFPRLSHPNEKRSLLYYHFPSLAQRLRAPELGLDGSGVVSIGPDRRDSLGIYRPFSTEFFARNFSGRGFGSPLDTVYSPTNGVISGGDLPVFAGSAAHFAVY